MALLAKTEGIFTDACYSGKIFHGFLDLVRSGKIPDGENAIFLHSGGTPAIWSKEHLDWPSPSSTMGKASLSTKHKQKEKGRAAARPFCMLLNARGESAGIPSRAPSSCG